nr:hypothetical protein [Paraburkholderia madseniana]
MRGKTQKGHFTVQMMSVVKSVVHQEAIGQPEVNVPRSYRGTRKVWLEPVMLHVPNGLNDKHADNSVSDVEERDPPLQERGQPQQRN